MGQQATCTQTNNQKHTYFCAKTNTTCAVFEIRISFDWCKNVKAIFLNEKTERRRTDPNDPVYVRVSE